MFLTLSTLIFLIFSRYYTKLLLSLGRLSRVLIYVIFLNILNPETKLNFYVEVA